MVAGVPVIAGTGGATSRRLAGRGGIAVPSASPEAVAAALGRLSSASVRAEMGAAAREIVSGHPGPEECAERLVRTLADAAGGPPARRLRPFAAGLGARRRSGSGVVRPALRNSS
jgi:glycosyltransferase involved in cell wall biosynthesis